MVRCFVWLVLRRRIVSDERHVGLLVERLRYLELERRRVRRAVDASFDQQGIAAIAFEQHRSHVAIGPRPHNLPAERVDQPPLAIGARCQRVEIKAVARRSGEFIEERARSEEHTSELQSLMRISYAVFCLTQTTEKQTSQITQ